MIHSDVGEIKMKTKLVHVTPESEKHIAYCARVSSPNQENPEFSKLLKYLIKHKHWSPYEMASMCLEITTSRGIAAQILRHRSFSFQEFSQRYAAAGEEFETYGARRQDLKNKQNSIDDMSKDDQVWFQNAQEDIQKYSVMVYDQALKRGIAKEQARFVLPLSVSTKLYMMGSFRSWMTYFITRMDKSTQLEHREIAKACFGVFKEHVPTIAGILEELYPEIFEKEESLQKEFDNFMKMSENTYVSKKLIYEAGYKLAKGENT
jgi:thymidylate synthase (FAD)